MNTEVAISRRAPLQYEVSDIERMARAISGSKLFGISSPEQALALCLIAQSEGRHPASAAQDYHIIQGKPSKKADAMLRDFLSAGGKVEWHTLDDTVADATFSHPAGGAARITWDMPRAKKAQLSTPMWTKYPRQMLRSRVVSEGVRTVFPMATSGMYVPEEVQDFSPAPSDGKVIELAADAPPKRIRDGSDGKPKSSRQAKLSGDWDFVADIHNTTTEAELIAWREAHAEQIGKFNGQWAESFEDVYDTKMEALKRADTTLAPAESAVLLKSLAQVVKSAETQTALRAWVREADTKLAIRSLTVGDYEAFETTYETRLGELPE